jgi:hypothetical protein
VEDWALIRRLVADGVPRRRVARRLGIGRSTVDRVLASDRVPKYERAAQPRVCCRDWCQGGLGGLCRRLGHDGFVFDGGQASQA